MTDLHRLKALLDKIYFAYNRRQYIDPDPLCFLFDYPNAAQREIAGFIAACLAYGRVEMIMKTVDMVLKKMAPDPKDYLATRSRQDMHQDFKGFRYRFADQTAMVELLWGIRQVIHEFSSLGACLVRGLSPGDDTVLPGLIFLSDQIRKASQPGHLLADPTKKSACKRSYLFLRWMVRRDAVDPGGWDHVSPAGLIVPLDTHMHTIGRILKFTGRKSADLKTALEITHGFRQLSPDDPVKYDFCLTRFGIRRELSLDTLRAFLNL